MPGSLTSILQQVLSGVTGEQNAETFSYRPVGGGSINETLQVYTRSNKRWFCKFNDATRFPGLFEKEASGLSLLHRQSRMRVPEVVACSELGDRQILVLEWIEEGPRSPAFWKLFGEQLARLHRVSGLSFGLEENNYMDALPQDNTPVTSPTESGLSPTTWPEFPPASWPDFMIQRRLEPQIRLAADHGLLDPGAIRHFERLYQVLPNIFGEPEPISRASPATFVLVEHCSTFARSFSRSLERQFSLRQQRPSGAHRPGRILWAS